MEELRTVERRVMDKEREIARKSKRLSQVEVWFVWVIALLFTSVFMYVNTPCLLGCTKIWRFHQKITEPSQKLGFTIRRKHANF